jgi:hypothetical protein
VTILDVYVRADGPRLAGLATSFAEGLLSLEVATPFPIADAAAALDRAVSGRGGGGTVLSVREA